MRTDFDLHGHLEKDYCEDWRNSNQKRNVSFSIFGESNEKKNIKSDRIA